MSCPKCNSQKVVSVKTHNTPESEQPMQCLECKTKWDQSTQEPTREWRLNRATGDTYRLVEVVDGKLVAVGLSYTLEHADEYGKRENTQHAKHALAKALTGMMTALELPVIEINQVITEEEV